MKTIITVLILLFCGNTQAQIKELDKNNYQEIGRIKAGRFLGKLSQYIDKEDTTYYLEFRNRRHKLLKRVSVISFKGKETIDQAYSIMNDIVQQTIVDNHRFMLGKTPIIIRNKWGFSELKLLVKTPYGYFKLKPDQIKSLFGK